MEIDKIVPAHPQTTDDEAMVLLNAHLKAMFEDAVRDEVDVQLLPVFLEEADELCSKIGRCLHALQEDNVHLIYRLLHTLKGSARMTGVMRIGQLAHEMEGRLLAAAATSAADFRDALMCDFEQINRQLEELRQFDVKKGPLDPADEFDPNGEWVATRVSQRLYRTVRQTARELGRRVNLELTGNNVAPDMLEKMTAPLEHLLRNAIVHGLEDEPQRIKSGKDPIGEISLNLSCENNEVVFELSDDGRGLNLLALYAEAVKKGLPEAGNGQPIENGMLSEDQLAQLIFIPGLSTASEVTELAGRGIGMDVVRSEIAALGGRIKVSSTPGLGTRFTIHIPLS